MGFYSAALNLIDALSYGNKGDHEAPPTSLALAEPPAEVVSTTHNEINKVQGIDEVNHVQDDAANGSNATKMDQDKDDEDEDEEASDSESVSIHLLHDTPLMPNRT